MVEKVVWKIEIMEEFDCYLSWELEEDYDLFRHGR